MGRDDDDDDDEEIYFAADVRRSRRRRHYNIMYRRVCVYIYIPNLTADRKTGYAVRIYLNTRTHTPCDLPADVHYTHTHARAGALAHTH